MTDTNVPKPISPAVAWETQTPPADLVRRINEYLSKPWSSYDRSSGRTYRTDGIEQHEREAIVSYFKSAGWDVTITDDQRDGSYFSFKPGKASETAHLLRGTMTNIDH